MPDLLDAAVAAFLGDDGASLHTTTGVDPLPDDADEPPIRDARERLEAYDSLVTDDGTVLLPLHGTDSAELTGEYVEYRPSGLAPSYVYHDASKGKQARLDPGAIGDTTLGWQLRFWTGAFEPSTEPTYVGKSDAESAVRADPVRTMDADERAAFADELVGTVEELRERDREDTREMLAERGYRHVCRTEGGIRETIYTGQRVTDSDGTVDVFTIPEEDDQRRFDIPGEHGIYPDSEVLLLPNPDASNVWVDVDDTPFPAEARVATVDDGAVGLSFFEDRGPGSAELRRYLRDDRAVFSVLALLNGVPYDRERAGIQAVRDSPEKWDVLTGQRPLGFTPEFTVDLDTELALNEFQETAAKRALRARDVYCIHGPPGTGKTRTLMAVVQQAVADGQRVLACAHSNQAVDNLLVGASSLADPDPGTLHAMAVDDDREEIDIHRVGHTESELIEERYTEGVVAGADVVGATTSMASQFDADEFDIAVLDEATQASIPASTIPYACAERLVLAGDHKQLPPFASDELQQREVEVSLFEHLLETYDDGVRTMLRRQYRMHEDIVAFPNRAFYDGDLETAERNREWTIDGMDSLVAYDIAEGEERTSGKSYRNPAEAEIVAEEVAELRERGVAQSDIGVITPYTGQIGCIQNALADRDVRTRGIKVNTVDSFQGSERAVILLSLVRSNDRNASGFLTFGDEGKRRLNVSLTRAKRRLVVVGDWETLGTVGDHQSPEESCADVYAALGDALSLRRPSIQGPSQ
ncbi:MULTISPECIES: AAA domain-containing protein [Halolamina]|uniref:AAA domain-containing protein n=1 Tax=Halolamina pelagica TaxID=699431 RepID=A0A1I5P313_9EURY|nr:MULTISPECIES: AAA domain-containing protein [Halolamina]NHX36586.1 AAA family ATPase [Halolamina sp. R1-12]SFP27931.1 AAA domain-containing protein [Halolamina pelagica]